jgi:endonuclease YncB( thermonuclease family)
MTYIISLPSCSVSTKATPARHSFRSHVQTRQRFSRFLGIKCINYELKTTHPKSLPSKTIELATKHSISLKIVSFPPITAPPWPALEPIGKCALSLAASFLLLTTSPALAKEEVFGIPRVIDGDTIVVNGTRIRLFGIDAPESKQSCTTAGKDYECGTASTNALVEKIGSAPVRCAVKRKDMYGRSVAICRLDPPKGAKIGEEGLDLNAWLVQEGWAVAYKRYSKAYVPLEAQAQEERKGIWSGNFEDPETWRKEHNGRTGKTSKNSIPAGVVASIIGAESVEKINGDQTPLVEAEPASAAVTTEESQAAVAMAPLLATSSGSSTPPAVNDSCLIKGNINAKGLKIYHVPGGRFYEATKIDTEAGEKLFCSEEEAIAAGWRPSKQ